MSVKIPFVPRPKASKSVPHFTNTHNIYTFSSAIAIGLGPLAPMAILPGSNAPKPTAGTGPCTILEVDRNLVSKFRRVCILVMFRARGLRMRIAANSPLFVDSSLASSVATGVGSRRKEATTWAPGVLVHGNYILAVPLYLATGYVRVLFGALVLLRHGMCTEAP